MNFVITIVKILQYFGLDPPPVVRERFFYPLWKLISYLSENSIGVFAISLVFISAGLLWFDAKRRKNKKNSILVFKKVYIGLISLIVIIGCYLLIKVWLYDPAKILQLRPDTLNIVVIPILNTDTQSYLHMDHTGTYEQEVLTTCLTNNMPQLPNGTKVSVKSLPAVHIPSFLYKPDDFNRFFKSIRNYTFIVWGYMADNKIEKIRLDINPDSIIDRNDKEQASLSKAFQNKLSDTTSVLFNDLEALPLHKKLDFLSLVIMGVVEQSLNTSLLEAKQYSQAKYQLSLCLSRIDSAFNNLLADAPSTKRLDLNTYHDSYRALFLDFRNNIELEEQDAIRQIQDAFNRVMANPYGPFLGPEQYFKWLSKQEDIYSIGRYFPVFGWKPNDTAFEFFVYKALDGRDNLIYDKDIHTMFGKLRAKYGDIFIIDYYEAIVLLATWVDTNRLGEILDRQKRTNKYNLDLTDKQIELYTTYVIATDKIR